MLQKTKFCKYCERHLPATLEYFYNRSDSKDGLRNDCKSCHYARAAAYREAHQEELRQYNKKYRAENKERISRNGREYRLKNQDKIRERRQNNAEQWKIWRRSWYERNIDHVREYHQRNKEKHNAYGRKRYKVVRDRILRVSSQWSRENRQKRVISSQNYRTRKAGLPDNFTEDDWQFALNHFNGCCAACGRPPGLFHCLAADHWVPLASNACPGTIPSNIVPLCHGDGGCNNAKQNRDPIEWLESTFGERQAQKVLERIHEFFSVARC